MTRTHSIQLMTADGIYALFYASSAEAMTAHARLKRAIATDLTWLEVADDEGLLVTVRTDKLHSFVLAACQPSAERWRPIVEERPN